MSLESLPGDDAELPADAFVGLWDILDTLPRATSSVDMAATTIDMVAVAASAPHGGRGRRPSWLLPAVAVCASLATGLIAGRMTVPDPDTRVLEYLPLIRHIETLREAGSVTFLQALADRRLPQPLRLPPDAVREEVREFGETLRDLEADHVWGNAAGALLTDRRAAIDALSADQQDALERAAAVFQELPTRERRQLATVAAVLADPGRQDLRNAARAWHLLIAASDPPDRRNIIELDEKRRLEWIDRRSRPRDWERGERRVPPPALEGGPPRGGPPGDGRPRRQGPRGDGAPQDRAPQDRGPQDRGPQDRGPQGGGRGLPRQGDPRREAMPQGPPAGDTERIPREPA